MSLHRSSIPLPGPGRISLVLLAVVPAVLAYPWPATRERWVLGVAVAVAILLLSWWQGLHLTTIVGRRLAMSRSRGGVHTDRRSGSGARATAALRIKSGAAGDTLPLSLISGYLNRYGLRADAVRITSHGTGDTWIGLTYSAAPNLAALQARSSTIPLQRTADIAVRRLSDHLREIGWDTALVADGDIPALIDAGAKETWRSVIDGPGDHVAAYLVSIDAALADTFDRIRASAAEETWTALEISGSGDQRTIAAACALRTGSAPDGTAPLAGLVPQQGNHRTALCSLHPLSGSRLDGHTALPADALAGLRWPVAAGTRSEVAAG
ncbi:type VII secretion protein EccE [[Mycobacterium] crassicus]|uniref:Type VII secretion protein EccE n=1 Tax=[Mycobacterium] crassicus TaxID=2872309 RepID=A0ABU5XDH4_9MYCO|nr:type VII secretion protein EccE [Mycolicibacter sp. MYC098]MEB3020365.1 type VII secretion protein EccE [Mycolicibacter sp. MYC098]